MVEKSLWTRKVEQDPQHSHWFVQRFRDMRAAGKDLAGEARLVDAMVPRGSRILDAGCGSGRTGGELAARGHDVVGVDVDAILIEAAQADYPNVPWILGDLADLPAALPDVVSGKAAKFDAIVAAGNVIPFLAPATRQPVLRSLLELLIPAGRFVLGFGAGRGYEFADFFDDVAATGWEVDGRYNGWDLHPFDADSEFLVTILRPRVDRAPSPDPGVTPLTLGRSAPPMPPLSW